MRFFRILKEVMEFLQARKKWWLFPVVLFLAVMGALMMATAGSPFAPFIYTLF